MKVISQKINGNVKFKYKQVYQSMVRRIRRGHYNGKLPGISQLATEYSVNPLTMRKALDQLAKESMIKKVPRVGNFVNHKRCIAVLELDKKHSGSHSLSERTIFDKILRGIHETMDKHNVSVLFQSCSPSEKDFIEFLKKDVDGFILITQQDIFDNDLTLFNDVPWVKAMGDIAATHSSNHVTYNNKIIGIQAAEHLIKQGCEKFIYLGNQENSIFQERYQEFSNRLEYEGYTSEAISVPYSMNVDEFAKLLQKNIRHINNDSNTGIFVAADRHLVVLYQVLYSQGIFPGRDIEILSCDNNDYHLHGLFPRPPVIDIRMDVIGSSAAEMLINKISTNGKFETEKVILTPEIVINQKNDVAS